MIYYMIIFTFNYDIVPEPTCFVRSKSTISCYSQQINSKSADNVQRIYVISRIPGFDRHGSTGWLRTNWPIQGGEEFTLTFSIHDEGDAIYDSLVLIDNFRWNDFEGASVTDPLN